MWPRAAWLRRPPVDRLPARSGWFGGTAGPPVPFPAVMKALPPAGRYPVGGSDGAGAARGRMKSSISVRPDPVADFGLVFQVFMSVGHRFSIVESEHHRFVGSEQLYELFRRHGGAVVPVTPLASPNRFVAFSGAVLLFGRGYSFWAR